MSLRTSTTLPRLILAWFVLVLAVAGASPVVRSMELVCTPDGTMKTVVVGEDGQAQDAGHHTLDCSLCLPAVLPPAHRRAAVDMPQPLAHALLPARAAHIAALVGAPLPPRGPPSRT